MSCIRLLKNSIQARCEKSRPLCAEISYFTCKTMHQKLKFKELDFSDFPEYAGVTSIIISNIEQLNCLTFSEPVSLKVTYCDCRTVFFPCQGKIDKHFSNFGCNVAEITITSGYCNNDCGCKKRCRGEAVQELEYGACGQTVSSGVVDIYTGPTKYECSGY